MQINVLYQTEESSWNLPLWDYFVSEISDVFRLSDKEKKDLFESNTAKIIATIPFEAGCLDPERTAISHLCLYMAEKQGFEKYCAHSFEDDKDIFHRLECISNYKGGDEKIIHHGKCLLALIMLEGYKRSAKKDQEYNIYNPIVSGIWNYRIIKNQLLFELSKIAVNNLDNLLVLFKPIGW